MTTGLDSFGSFGDGGNHHRRGRRVLRGAKATTSPGWSKLSSKETLGRLAAEVMAQAGGVSLDPAEQNFKRWELEFGRLRRVVTDVVMVMPALFGPSIVVSFLVPSLILWQFLLAWS